MLLPLSVPSVRPSASLVATLLNSVAAVPLSLLHAAMATGLLPALQLKMVKLLASLAFVPMKTMEFGVMAILRSRLTDATGPLPANLLFVARVAGLTQQVWVLARTLDLARNILRWSRCIGLWEEPIIRWTVLTPRDAK